MLEPQLLPLVCKTTGPGNLSTHPKCLTHPNTKNVSDSIRAWKFSPARTCVLYEPGLICEQKKGNVSLQHHCIETSGKKSNVHV